MGQGTMDLFRSEEMQLMQLMVPAESAHDTVTALGDVGLLQFKDLNPDTSAFQKTYASQVKRCDEMARKLRFFTDQVTKSEVPVGSRFGGERDLDLDTLERKLDELEGELVQMNNNAERLQRSFAELTELQLVLERAQGFFEDQQFRSRVAESSANGEAMDAPLLSEPAMEPKSVRLGFVAGIIQQEKTISFERLLFRATRGNMFLRTAAVGAVTDPGTTEQQEKSVYVVFFAGERARAKIMKICEAFGANRYPFPEEAGRQRQMNSEVNSRLRELHSTIDAGERHRNATLQSIASSLEAWTVQVKREKGVYHTLNKLSVDVTRKVLVAEAWCPVSAKPAVQRALKSASESASATVGTVFQPLMTYEAPPTYFSTGKFTESFQNIVDAYGMARYREVNPGVFTIVTFPFLFAVMFGDVGHGFLMLFVALYFVLNEKMLGKNPLNDMVDMLFSGRYMILFMSIFSIYCGFIYNECFSIPTTTFGTGHWGCQDDLALSNRAVIAFNETLCPSAYIDGLQSRGGAYAFGVDPTWHGTRTELQFLNSVKMKLSIVIGVIQMDVGILLSFLNQRYFRDALSTYCEFIPQMVFLNGLFGYLSLLIVGKWISGSTADLYHVMIYMFLSPGSAGLKCDDGEGHYGCAENQMFPGQGPLQVLLVLAAVIAVPIMLIPKPLILKKRAAKRAAQLESYGQVQRDDPEAPDDGQGMHVSHGGGEHEEEFDFGEVMVHQMIHTIEFVLGAVSNTASYLRLWALSLAHSQLSAVFYERVMLAGLQVQTTLPYKCLYLFIGFFVFACATLGVLMVMESLSAFLHAMRLHWVEFNNKFYHGDGYKFTPMSFKELEKESL